VEDALASLRDHRLTPLAGTTDLYVALNFGTLGARRFLDLTPLHELREISARDGVLRIGAMATYTDIIESPLANTRLPMLVEAARQTGGVQIQNRGTLGGNIANGSPAGDSLPVLSVADAILILRSASTERRVGFAEFYTGYRTSVLRPDELIIAVEVPELEGRQWFRKVGTRAAQAISKIVMAGLRAATPRIALGSVAPTVVRLPHTERALATLPADASPNMLDEPVRVLHAEIHPIDDIRSTAEYRRQVAGNLLRRFWADTSRA
jgi:CO/xanthine dehydrogenase FAD-binding subunit